jgi:hypothetical protein
VHERAIGRGCDAAAKLHPMLGGTALFWPKLAQAQLQAVVTIGFLSGAGRGETRSQMAFELAGDRSRSMKVQLSF